VQIRMAAVSATSTVGADSVIMIMRAFPSPTVVGTPLDVLSVHRYTMRLGGRDRQKVG
jgi:hypothetical protein